ncbi:hypothetical protein BD780_003922 [Clostridium tetanomorphum]|uniref:hypothetical protein n=1 Tax=Clostridium tetanomorphum TaxID=1553 RepID=UPI0004464585|nr:hypothetical protein [Clostridium tetanomorphum]KAJ49940.1 hypothetical protein CTM_20316 [Clostridium tetanomorphum DSM 665]MBP1866069.1 hypothetical protein [Clostridium tetanomorphum]NRS86697.1 hypothetical protein [Clostridium tetanomorphum]SQC00513.1 Uncharacterised protein [Clostridium tetanomorphum]
MGNMYKETIKRRKLPSLLKLFIILVSVLFFIEIIEGLTVSGQNVRIIAMIFCTTLVILTLIFEIFRCRVRYTYSIIADQFIIHKIKGSEDKVVENIKLRNIQYIGQKSIPKFKEDIISSKKYVCSILNFSPYCCIYRDGSNLKRFYFEPSNNLIEKIKFHRNKKIS